MKKSAPRQDEDPETYSEPPTRHPARGRSWLFRFVVFLLLVAGLVWFAPAIVAHTPAWNWCLSQLNAQLPVQVSTGTPQLGWLSPILLPAVQVTDAKGEILAQVETVQTDKTLLTLALNQSDLGTITLVRPRVHVELPPPKERNSQPRDEREVPPALEQSPTTVPQLPSMIVQIQDGIVELHDQESDRTWTAGKLELLLRNAGGDRPFEFDTTCALASAGPSSSPEQQAAGTVQIKGMIQLTSAAIPLCDVQIDLSGLDTAVVRPLARQANQDLSMAGRVTVRCSLRHTEDGLFDVRLAELAAEELALAAPEYLGNDVVRLRQVGGQGTVTLQGEQIAARQLVIVSDVARVEADGLIRLGEFTPAGLFAALAEQQGSQPLQIGAQVDLAGIMRQLPDTIHLRPGTEVRTGKLVLRVQRDPNSAAPRVTGKLEASDLLAINEGRNIRLDKPVVIDFAVGNSPQGPQLESLACDSEFLQVQASGTLAQGNATIRSDLNQLMRKLDQLVDLPQLTLAGTIDGEIRWQQGQQESWQAQTGLTLRNFHARLPGMLPWKEQELQLTAAISGILADESLQRIDQGSASVVASGDLLEVQLVGAVPQPSSTSDWPISWRLSGNLATWLPRLQPFMSVKRMRGTGELSVEGTGTVSPQLVSLERVKLTGSAIRGTMFDLNVNEETVLLETGGRWDSETGSIELPVTTFACNTLSFRADQIKVGYGSEGFSVTGSIDYRADAERLAALTAHPRKAASSKFSGLIGGRVILQHAQGKTQATIHGTVDQLVYSTLDRPRGAAGSLAGAGGWKEQWREPRIGIKGGLAYLAAEDRLELGKLLVQAEQIQLETDGVITQLLVEPILDLHGTIAYDLADVTLKLRPILGPSLAMTGKELRQFSLSGPIGSVKATSTATGAGNAPMAIPAEELISPNLSGEASAGWHAAEYLGLQFGAAQMNAKLAQGIVNFVPIEIPVSSGKLIASPSILLNNQPSMVVLDRGPLLDRVEITPELCRGWLMFVAPLLANATSAQGQFSVQLDGAAIPLFEPDMCEVEGNTQIHAATVGPGPLATQMIAMAQQVKGIADGKALDFANAQEKTWLKMSDENVKFRVAQGRVYHQGMKITIKDIEITTEGSVGFDQTLELVASIPIRDAWLKKDVAAAALKGQTIQIPIRGEISKPQIDNRALEQLAKQMVRGAAQGVIENELNKGLQKLFGPKP